jgi:hypothetical protein
MVNKDNNEMNKTTQSPPTAAIRRGRGPSSVGSDQGGSLQPVKENDVCKDKEGYNSVTEEGCDNGEERRDMDTKGNNEAHKEQPGVVEAGQAQLSNIKTCANNTDMEAGAKMEDDFDGETQRDDDMGIKQEQEEEQNKGTMYQVAATAMEEKGRMYYNKADTSPAQSYAKAARAASEKVEERNGSKPALSRPGVAAAGRNLQQRVREVHARRQARDTEGDMTITRMYLNGEREYSDSPSAVTGSTSGVNQGTDSDGDRLALTTSDYSRALTHRLKPLVRGIAGTAYHNAMQSYQTGGTSCVEHNQLQKDSRLNERYMRMTTIRMTHMGFNRLLMAASYGCGSEEYRRIFTATELSNEYYEQSHKKVKAIRDVYSELFCTRRLTAEEYLLYAGFEVEFATEAALSLARDNWRRAEIFQNMLRTVPRSYKEGKLMQQLIDYMLVLLEASQPSMGYILPGFRMDPGDSDSSGQGSRRSDSRGSYWSTGTPPTSGSDSLQMGAKGGRGGYLAAHMANPSCEHHVALKHVLHYLHGT